MLPGQEALVTERPRPPFSPARRRYCAHPGLGGVGELPRAPGRCANLARCGSAMLTTQELVAKSTAQGAVIGRVVARRPEVVRVAAPIGVGRWLAGLAVADATAGAVAVVLALGLRLGNAGQTVEGGSAPAVAAIVALIWCLGLLSCGAYDRRLLGTGAGEFQRVV